MSDNFQAQMLELESEEESISLDEKTIAEKISTIVGSLDRSERSTRDRMLRLWKYLELLWAGAGNYYWDYSVGQWRAITQEDISLLSQEADLDPTLINKVINLIRPYGESLIGVLTTGLPRVKYFPKSADNDLDIQASKAYTNVEQKIIDDNMMPIRLMEILVKLWNGGFAAAYNYTHEDPKYGTVTEDVFVEKDYTQESLICANCGNETLGEKAPKVHEASDEEALNVPLSQDETLLDDIEPQEELLPPVPPEPEMPEMVMNECSVCMTETPHLKADTEGFGPVKDGEVELNKSRQIINIFGPMNVKIPSMAVRKEHIFWLILEEEIDVAQAKYLYPDHRDKIEASTGSDIDIDRLSRAGYEIADDTLRECATIRKVWLTPAAYEKLEGDIETIEKLKAEYPSGIKAIFCANTFLEAEEEDLHEHWTISINPLYTKVMADPLGKALIGLQETANDLYQMEVDTVRHAIPQTFVDPKVLDPKAYSQQRSVPGGVTFTKTVSGDKSIKDYFFETRSATLPNEVGELDLKVEKLFQFISGVLPAVFGGPATGSKTLGEYQESKNQALQRLSIIWKIVTVMYAELMAKTTKQYVKNLKEDEFFVKEQGTGNYINVWLRREQFKGEIGEVRPEISEQFPMTWGQKSARIMELIAGGNEAIISTLFHPENIEIVYQTFGIDELYVPGEDQRNKQLYEISEMLTAEPVPMGVDPMTGQESFQPSVNIEEIDDDTIHMEVIKAFLNSSIGIDLKITNPYAYQNIMAHYQMHMMRYQEMMMQQQMQAQEVEASNSNIEQVQ